MPKKQAITKLSDAQVMSQLKHLLAAMTPAERRIALVTIFKVVGSPPKQAEPTDVDCEACGPRLVNPDGLPWQNGLDFKRSDATKGFRPSKRASPPALKRNAARKRAARKLVQNIIDELEEYIGKRVPIEEILNEAIEKGLTKRNVMEIIAELKKEGHLFEIPAEARLGDVARLDRNWAERRK